MSLHTTKRQGFRFSAGAYVLGVLAAPSIQREGEPI